MVSEIPQTQQVESSSKPLSPPTNEAPLYPEADPLLTPIEQTSPVSPIDTSPPPLAPTTEHPTQAGGPSKPIPTAIPTQPPYVMPEIIEEILSDPLIHESILAEQASEESPPIGIPLPPQTPPPPHQPDIIENILSPSPSFSPTARSQTDQGSGGRSRSGSSGGGKIDYNDISTLYSPYTEGPGVNNVQKPIGLQSVSTPEGESISTESISKPFTPSTGTTQTYDTGGGRGLSGTSTHAYDSYFTDNALTF